MTIPASKAPLAIDQRIAHQAGSHVITLQRTRFAYTVVVELSGFRVDERSQAFGDEGQARAFARRQALELRPGVPAAIVALASAGVGRATLVAELGVHPTTIARWAAGTTAPSRRNRAALRALVDELHAAIDAEDVQLLADERQVAALRRARQALTTDADRAGDDALAARLAADLERYAYPPCDDDVVGAA